MTPSTCHLYFILAREAPIGVIFRRGPQKWVQLIKWRTDTDVFEAGQWFHGRIKGEDSDLSPSGDKLVYSAQNYQHSKYDPKVGRCWTAVSKPPYLTALVLWPNIVPSYGGGIFESEHYLHLRYPHADLPVSQDYNLPSVFEYDSGNLDWDSHGSGEMNRLERDGWKSVNDVDWRVKSKEAAVYEKAGPGGRHILVSRNNLVWSDFMSRFYVKDRTQQAALPIERSTQAD